MPDDENERDLSMPRGWLADLAARLRPSRWTERAFRFALLTSLPLLCLAAGLVLRNGSNRVLPAFAFFLDNLPLTLPILTVVLSVMLRPDALTRHDGWLNLCNHFALGLVSFAIWAFVAGQGVDQYIRINPTKVLNKEHSLLLVFGSFIWAGFCSVVSALATIGEDRQQRKWRLLQVLLVAFSLNLLLMPFYLFEDTVTVEKRLGVSFDEMPFTVSIPFRDPALNLYLGRSTNPITQCAVYRSLTARTPRAARDKALKQFRESDDSLQFVPAGREVDAAQHKRVEILENLVVASVEGTRGG